MPFDSYFNVKHHLVLLHRALVEHLGRDVFGRNVDALGARFIQHVGEQPHLKLEAQNVHPGDVLLAAFKNHLLYKQARDRSPKAFANASLSKARSSLFIAINSRI